MSSDADADRTPGRPGAGPEPPPRLAGIPIPPDAPDAPGNARNTPGGLWALARPGNAVLAGFGVAIGALAGAGPGPLHDAPGTLFLAALTGTLGTAFGNMLNDLDDHGIDRLAHPDRPLPHGRATRIGAWNVALLTWIGTIGAAAAVGETFLLLTVLLLALLFAYERVLKPRGLVGNMAVAIAAGALFPLGALAFAAQLDVPLVLGLLAAFAHLGRELLKDAEDHVADRSTRRTFAVRHGPAAAARLGGLFLLTGVVVSPLPHFFAGWGVAFLAAVAPADALFVVAAWRGISDPGAGRKAAKVAMVVALVAFAGGAWVYAGA